MNKDGVIEIIGKRPGPTSIIMAGVHGDEKCGIEAFKNILPNLRLEKGRVFFIYGNPRAIKLNTRSTQANLNRMFKNKNLMAEEEKRSYEYKHAQVLKKYLKRAEALLDIHASSNPKSRPFLICEPNSADITQYLPFPTVVYGFDSVEPGGTDYYMNSIGKVGICAECGYNGNPLSTQVAEKSIYAFLAARGHITRPTRTRPQSQIRMYRLYLTKTDDFRLARKFSDFEKLTKGELIGIDGPSKIRATRDSIILFPHDCKEIGSEAFLLGQKKEPASRAAGSSQRTSGRRS